MKPSVFIKNSRIHEPVETVFAWHERPGAIERLSPPWDNIRLVGQTSGIQPGSRVRLTISPIGAFPVNWTARHTAYEKNRLFQDVQEKGPFSTWVHTHRFFPDGDHACRIEDRIEYTLPFHTAAIPLIGNTVHARLERIFAYRHRTLSADMVAHRKYDLSPMKILVSGSSGVIASTLIPFLTTGGHRVFRMVRSEGKRGSNAVYYNPSQGFIEAEKMENMDAVIHLAGENIGSAPWTAAKKKRILESRTQSTALLAAALAGLKHPPKLFACASAIGYYGNRGEEVLDESARPGNNFISAVCRQWEASAKPAVRAGIRTVFLRIGVVLTPAGGALQKLLPLFRTGLGGTIGSGRQYISWIGIDDMAELMLHVAANPNIEGPLNVVGPQPVTNADFAKTLGRVLSRPSVFRVPETPVHAVFGQMGAETVLSSTRVMPEKLAATGYRFRHPDLTAALSHVLGKAP